MSAGFPTVFDILEIARTPSVAFNFLKDQGAFFVRRNCNFGNPMIVINYKSRGLTWKCSYRKCPCGHSRVSYLSGSFFGNRKIEINKVLLVLYFFLLRSPLDGIIKTSGLSKPTVSAIIMDILRVMEADLKIEDVQVGGLDSDGNRIVVEIDESKFGKRKGNKGHGVEGVWVVGGVERTPERKAFFLTVPNRTGHTLKLIIDNFVKDGSHVMVDCWKGYYGIDSDPERNLVVERVNHSKNFKDPETGACTNTIEGTWNAIKMNVPYRQRNSKAMPWKLVEFIWRRKHQQNPWQALIKNLSEISFDEDGSATKGQLVSLLTQVFLEDEEDDEDEVMVVIKDKKTTN